MEFFCSHEQKRKFQEQKIPRIFEVTLVVLTPLYIQRLSHPSTPESPHGKGTRNGLNCSFPGLCLGFNS